MKLSKSLIVMAAIFPFLLISCQKEKLSSDSNEIINNNSYSGNGNGSNIMQLSSSGIEQINGLLQFQSMEHFKSVLNDLEHQADEWDSTFVAENSEMTLEELNNYEEQINFDSQKPLTDFENLYNFYSLRKEILTEEEIWLQNEVFDPETDPDNHFVVTVEERTLLNPGSEVKIGDDIYKLTEVGYYQITDGDFTTLDRINNSDTIENENCIFIWGDGSTQRTTGHVGTPQGPMGGGGGPGGGGGGGSSCDARGLKRNWDYEKNYQENRRIKWVVSVWTHPWNCGAIAKTKSYKKKSNGGWKKYRADLGAIVFGKMVDDKNGCSQHSVYASDSKTAKKVKTQRVGPYCKTESGLIHGGHDSYSASISYNSTLTW